MALLLTVATGAWAQDPEPIDHTPSADGTVWTLSNMPEYDVELEVTYYTDEEVAEMEEAAFTEGVDLTYDEASGTWKLPSQEEWTLVKNANSGSSLNSAITNAGGTAIPTVHFDHETGTTTGKYWLSTEGGFAEAARTWGINGYDEIAVDSQDFKTSNNLVRAIIVF